MNWDEAQGKWTELRGTVREQWGKLTDDDLEVISGRRDKLVGKLLQRYGSTKESVEAEVKAFERRMAHVARAATEPELPAQ